MAVSNRDIQKSNRLVVSVTILSAVFVLGCGIPRQDFELPKDVSLESITAYQSTLWPVVQTHCSSCHGVDQEPLFAVNDLQTSYLFVKEKPWIDFENPSESELYEEVKNGNHHGITLDVANELLLQIENWAAILPK